MRVGIDSYCFHRYFGEVYAGLQRDPGTRWTAFDFVAFARSLGVDGVSLESCFLPSRDQGFLAELKVALDEARLERAFAWGHPDGFEGGGNAAMLDDLMQHLPAARALGTTVMRIVGSSLAFRSVPVDEQIARLTPLLREAARVAAANGVVLGIENHIDFTSEDIVRLLDAVDSPHLRVTLDTGNALRVFEDPVVAARRLAPWVVATHIKDVTAGRGAPRDWTFWPSVPLGRGLIDLPGVFTALREARYAGLLCVEIDNVAPPHNVRPEEELVRESVEYLRQQVG
ncbi:MAG: sugar phosphate isomerase/epimerase, partial [Chloroflexi bacterium]|nr:sugar phosphate isomerase/epimerase [Chloroflexota bacterium]